MSTAEDPAKQKFRELRALCREYGIIPEAYLIPPGSLSEVSEFEVAHGAFGAVYKGKYTDPEGRSVDVAIKELRTICSSAENTRAVRKVCAICLTFGIAIPNAC